MKEVTLCLLRNYFRLWKTNTKQKIWEDNEDRKTIEIFKDKEPTVTICCLCNVQDGKNNLLRMDYNKFHDRWANCDYEEAFNCCEDVENIYDDIVFWVENTEAITEEFYDKYSEQQLDLTEYMRRNLETLRTI